MKVLIVEDEPVTQNLLKATVSGWGFEPVTADDALQATILLEEDDSIQLFIIDWSLPWLDGVEFSKRVKEQAKNYCYIIMLTSRSGTENLIAAMKAGVDDYLTKPFIPEELQVRLNVGRRIIEQEQKLSFYAQNDELTGVWNRRMINQFLDREWARAKREQSAMAVLVLDIDFFKRINDEYGHQSGDEALKHFCAVVNSHLRKYDYFGRYGGEEFLLLLPHIDLESARHAAERIRSAVADSELVLTGQKQILQLTVSIGLAVVNESDQSAEATFKRADEALYRAKEQGRNRISS